MVDDRRDVLTVGLQKMNQILDSSSSSSQEELQALECLDGLNRRMVIPRLENYVEQVLPALSGQEFKSHFRYFIYLIVIPKAICLLFPYLLNFVY